MSKRTEFAISLKLLTEKFKKGLDGVKGSLNKFKNSISGAFSTREISGFTKSVNGMGSAFSSQMKNIKSQMGGMQTHISNLGKTIAGVFAVDKIVDFGKSIINVGSTFQSQMARVKAVSNATTEEFEMMRKEAERLGATTRYSATEAAQALENLLRNGLKTSEATKALGKVLELATSQAIELAEAADIATAVMNGFGKSAKDLGQINDVLASAASSSATNVTELMEALKNVAPIANSLGMSLEEVCAALGTFADFGVKGSMAGNTLRGMLNRLIKPTKQGQEALNKYGLSISEAELKAKGFTNVLEELAKAQMSLADLKDLFGEEYGSNSGGLIGRFQQYTEKKTTVENSEGTAERQTEQGQGAFEKAVADLKSTWDTFLTKMFNNSDGIFVGIVNGIKAVVKELENLSTWVTVAIGGLGVLVGRTFRKIANNTKKDIAGVKAEFSTDAYAAIAVKHEYGNLNSENLASLENAYKGVTSYLNILRKLHGEVADVNKKIVEDAIKTASSYQDNLERRIDAMKQLQSANQRLNELGEKQKPIWYKDTSQTNSTWAKRVGEVGDASETIGGLGEWAKKAEEARKKAQESTESLDQNTQSVNQNGKSWTVWAKGIGKALKWFSKGMQSEWGKKIQNWFQGNKNGKNNIYTNKENFDKATKEYEEWAKKQRDILEEISSLESEIQREKRKGINEANKAQSLSGKSFDELKNLDADELNKSLEESIQSIKKANSGLNQLKAFGSKVGGFFANLGKSIYAAMGGWIGMVTTAVSIAIKWIWNLKAEADRAFNEIKEAQKEIISRYASMESQVMSLVSVMQSHNQESMAWKTAMNKLSSEYPDLLKYMDLEEIKLGIAADRYATLKSRILDVIAAQREMNLNEHKQESINKLQKDYSDKTSGIGNRLTKIFTGAKRKGDKDGLTKEAAEIVATQIRSDITTMLSEGVDKSKITEFLKKKFVEYGISQNSTRIVGSSIGGASQSSSYNRAEEIAGQLYDKYQRYGKTINSINSLKSDYEEYPDKVINELVNIALERFEKQSLDIQKTYKATGKSEEDINSAIDNTRETILNKLVEDLNNLSYQIDGKNALDYAKDLGLFDKLLSNKTGKSGKGGSTTTTTTTTTITGSGDSKTPKQLFDETKKYIDALKDAGIIDEKEYRERLLSAYDTYISGLESLKKTDDESLELIKTLNKERDKLKDQIRAAADAEENMKKINEELAEKRKKELEEDQERGKEASEIKKAGLKAKSRYDKYPKYNELNGVFASDLLEGSVLAPLEHDLQRLKDYLDDLNSISSLEEINDQLSQIEDLKGEGVEALREQLNRLKKEIEDAELAATDLDEKIQLRRAKKEIQDMTDEVGLMGYETGKGLFTTVDGLVNSLEELYKSWDENELDFGEIMIQGIFGTIDAIISMVQMIKQLQEAWELLTFKKKALETAEAVSAQAGAAAVVTAEAEKTAAITGAVAAQTTAVLAAKTAQTKAATIAMAAESAAAFAGIPIAGPALAAAQIAEFQALIAAAAALPMFAEGGIVGGTKYVGDQNLARVNSGEMIINRSQQGKLWDAISGGKYGSNNSLSGNVEFKISGQVLRGVLNNHDKKMSKIKG